ncbi:MAG: ribonuclease D [Tepidisphaeraceae bacterium]
MAWGMEGSSGGQRPSRPPRWQHRAHSDANAHAGCSGSEPSPSCDHPLVSRQPPELITQQDQLTRLLEYLKAAGSFAYDSEFIGELSYEPQLCLIQVASASRIALIDPLAQIDVTPFWELVAEASVEKVVHAGLQDVEPLFRRVNRPPANLFDTQIAAGFVGLGYPLSLSKLVGAVLGVKLSKGLTFTHWDRRPLSDHQLRYAADDVRYLPAVRQEIGKRLEAAGHSAWAKEESSALADPSLYAFDPERQYLRLRGAGGLPPRNQAVLRELMNWRDQAARQEDLPPRTLLRDQILIEMARAPVESVAGLAKVRGLPRPVESAHGAEIVQATRRAMALPHDQLPTVVNHEPTPPDKFRADALHFALQCLCAGRQIDPTLVASRQEIGELYRLWRSGEDPSAMRLLRGWRRQAVGEALLALLRGEQHLSVRWTGDALQTSVGRIPPATKE